MTGPERSGTRCENNTVTVPGPCYLYAYDREETGTDNTTWIVEPLPLEFNDRLID
jgi:hypothetical protein